MVPRLVVFPSAESRLDVARSWLLARDPSEPVLVVGATREAAADLVASAACARSGSFGWQPTTIGRLAAALATPDLARRDLVAASTLTIEALMARAVHRLAEDGALGRLAALADRPGLPRALTRTLTDLRLAGVDGDILGSHDADLARVLAAWDDECRAARVADRAEILRRAADAAATIARPTLWLDVPLDTVAEAGLARALAAAAPDVLVTALPADAAAWSEALGVSPDVLPPVAAGGALGRLQHHLFAAGEPERGTPDDTVVIVSAPGEGRECLELARRARAEAARGVPFDRIAVLLRSPEEYRRHVVEAFRRAGVPVHLARGTRRPDPAGRAILALLACAAEGLSARRFAEYLSLGEVPDADASGAPPPATSDPAWAPPDVDALRDDLTERIAAGDEPVAAPARDGAPVLAGSLRAPRGWEELLVDAAVIGGLDRWRRRLDGLARQLAQRATDADDPALAERARLDGEGLERLRRFALPLLEALDALPRTARWSDWIGALSALAARALRDPERVLSVLAELAPMGPVGPVDLAELRVVLGPRLGELALPPPSRRHGRVFVGDPDAARGLSFDVVLVPGLAEGLFPRRIAEDPLLADDARQRIADRLEDGADRLSRERRALAIAVGAARRRLVVSWPRLDAALARPRVPSFYGLELVRAATGRLPDFEELMARAESARPTRLGWPAPDDPADALDDAEYDLAVLAGLRRAAGEAPAGSARYLVEANPHLARALRTRYRRSRLDRWTAADGLVLGPGDSAAAEALRVHALDQRSYSPTALQHFAACPYRFLLSAVHRLAPREEPGFIEEMDPLQKGSLVHDVLFTLLSRLRQLGLLPVGPDRLGLARAHLDATVEEVARRHREELAPSIDRVWEDEVAGIRADLGEWLRRMSEDPTWVPWRFELAFGLPGREGCDPQSRDEPVALPIGLSLRGAIDLVEEGPGGRLRATDYKTGKARVAPGRVLSGGEALQPVLYAMAVARMLPDREVVGGRLYYCTAAGGFEERFVPLDEGATAAAQRLADTVGNAVSRGFLPDAPRADACRFCDYRDVCGPHRERHAARKPARDLQPLAALREER